MVVETNLRTDRGDEMPPEKEIMNEAMSWWGVAGVTLIAFVGGTVRYYQYMWVRKKKFSWRLFALDTIPAMFVGLLVGLSCKGLNIDQSIAGVIGGLLGHQASIALKVATRRAIGEIEGD